VCTFNVNKYLFITVEKEYQIYKTQIYIFYFSETNRDCKESKLKRRAYPPITPQAFTRDMALSECFDHVWAQVCFCLLGFVYVPDYT